MKKLFEKSLLIMGVFVIATTFASCSDSDDENSEETKDDYNYNSYNTNLLKGTSWKLTKSTTTKNGEVTEAKNIGTSILSFSDVLYEADWHTEDDGEYYNLYSSSVNASGNTEIAANTFSGFWYCYDENKLSMWTEFGNLSAFQRGWFSGTFAPSKGQEIVSLTSSSLHLRFTSEEYNTVDDRYYTKTNYSNIDNGGSSSTYEKPEIGFHDFTAWTSKLKVVYKIYNKDEAKVTSAKIYYGTSRNPSQSVTATVSGVLITAHISGLEAGTEYYVKCSATGKGGTSTTDVTKCITNYN